MNTLVLLIIIFIVVAAASFVGFHFAFKYFEMTVELKEQEQKVQFLKEKVEEVIRRNRREEKND